MKMYDPLENRSDDNIKSFHLFQNKNFWIIIIVAVRGIMSHIFIPTNYSTPREVVDQAKTFVSELKSGHFDREEKTDKEEDSDSVDENGMNTINGANRRFAPRNDSFRIVPLGGK